MFGETFIAVFSAYLITVLGEKSKFQDQFKKMNETQKYDTFLSDTVCVKKLQ